MLYIFGDYTLDIQRYELCHHGAPVKLRPKVFQVLAYLLAHRDRVVPKQELCDRLWATPGVSDETLDSCIAVARRAVGDSGRVQGVIHTRHGYGYRFVALVEVCSQVPLDDTRPASRTSQALAPLVHEPASPVAAPFLAVAPLHTDRLAGAVAAGIALAPPLTLSQRPLAGERKVVTVLVCMLIQAALVEQCRDVEALHQARQALFGLLLDAVQRYGGTLQQVGDDGGLALFGAPVAQEDHAPRAVLAALALLQRLRAAGTAQACPDGQVCPVRLGIHTGQLVLGSLGDAQPLLYTPVGDTTRRATWLAQHAVPGTILVSEETARLVHEVVHLEICPSVSSLAPSHQEPTYPTSPGLNPAARPCGCP